MTKVQVTKTNRGSYVIAPVRLSYTHLTEPYKSDGAAPNDPGKYTTAVLIPKSEKDAIAAIQAAVEEAAQRGKATAWGGRIPGNLKRPLRDGSEKDNGGEAYENAMFFNASSKNRVPVYDRNNIPISDPEQIYSGMWAAVEVVFYPFAVTANKGVAVGLNSVKKMRDGERFGAAAATPDVFDCVAMEDDDDDM